MTDKQKADWGPAMFSEDGTAAEDHPNEAVLSAYDLDLLDEETAAEVRTHLVHCPDCRTLMIAADKALSDEDLIDPLTGTRPGIAASNKEDASKPSFKPWMIPVAALFLLAAFLAGRFSIPQEHGPVPADTFIIDLYPFSPDRGMDQTSSWRVPEQGSIELFLNHDQGWNDQKYITRLCSQDGEVLRTIPEVRPNNVGSLHIHFEKPPERGLYLLKVYAGDGDHPLVAQFQLNLQEP